MTFVAKVLCDTHNGALGPLDAAAGLAFSAIEALVKDVKKIADEKKALESFHISSGLDIERWMIKVFCGLVAAGRIRGSSWTDIATERSSVVFSGCAIGEHLFTQPPRALSEHLRRANTEPWRTFIRDNQADGWL